MGGVNFTRNRAWWHTAIWDEYGQRHQYVMIIPTMALLIPYYWHNSFSSRDLEQNFAKKMYQMEYESKRNRLTHNLIMEHFEMHVESAMDILDSVNNKGFEKTFSEYLDQPLYTPYDVEKGDFNYEDTSSMPKEVLAEYLHDRDVNRKATEIVWSNMLPLTTRNYFNEIFPRRPNPFKPFKHLGTSFPMSLSKQGIEHYVPKPELDLSEDEKKYVKVKGAEDEEAEDEE